MLLFRIMSSQSLAFEGFDVDRIFYCLSFGQVVVQQKLNIIYTGHNVCASIAVRSNCELHLGPVCVHSLESFLQVVLFRRSLGKGFELVNVFVQAEIQYLYAILLSMSHEMQKNISEKLAKECLIGISRKSLALASVMLWSTFIGKPTSSETCSQCLAFSPGFPRVIMIGRCSLKSSIFPLIVSANFLTIGSWKVFSNLKTVR